jgi:Mn-dependent DtxR family transcriptional regulator
VQHVAHDQAAHLPLAPAGSRSRRQERFTLPQAILAEMLGVRRQSVSAVATELRRKGLIEYRRGQITIVNRKKLEAAACCECYGVMNSYYHRLLPAA